MKKELKFGVKLGVVALLLYGCDQPSKEITTQVVVQNGSDLKLTDEPVSIERSKLIVADSLDQYPLLLTGKDTIPSQLNDLDGDGKWDELFFVANFDPGQEKLLKLQWVNKKPDYPVRTSVRFGKREAADEPVQPATEETIAATDMPKKLGFQKYQTDGPSWENDKVGFRHYLDGRNANDIFGKKTSAISPEDVGINDKGEVEDNYHVMEDWGRDIFPVGNSVGLGGFALLVDGQVERLGVTAEDTLSNIEQTKFQILDEGPVKSVLDYKYHDWKAAGNIYDAEEITSIWPGMYGFQNKVTLKGLQGNETLLIGLSNINNEKPLQEIEVGDYVALVAHDYQTYDRQWLLGTALILPKAVYEGYMEAPEKGQLTDSFLAKMKVENGKAVTYYPVAAWGDSSDGNFKNADYFRDYVVKLAKQLSVKLDVKVSTSEDSPEN